MIDMIKCDNCVFDVDGVVCSALTKYKIDECKFYKSNELYRRDGHGFVVEKEVPEDGETKA